MPVSVCSWFRFRFNACHRIITLMSYWNFLALWVLASCIRSCCTPSGFLLGFSSFDQCYDRLHLLSSVVLTIGWGWLFILFSVLFTSSIGMILIHTRSSVGSCSTSYMNCWHMLRSSMNLGDDPYYIQISTICALAISKVWFSGTSVLWYYSTLHSTTQRFCE